jgi:hypothetical protein
LGFTSFHPTYRSGDRTFFYSSYFHPEIKYDYSVQAAIAPEDCGKLTMIPGNAADFIDP